MTTATSTIKNLIFAIAMILPASALAQDPFRMEAGLSCPNGNCGMRMMKLGGLEGVAKLQKINIFESDDRQIEKTADQPNQNYLPIGSLKNDVAVSDSSGDFFEGVQGTAFLISPCLIVTNYHVVYGVQVGGPNPQKKYSSTFTIGKGAGQLTAKATPVVHGNYRGVPGSGDWAILKLEDKNCLGSNQQVGWMETAALSDPKIVSQKLMLAGYFGDRDFSTPYADPFCQVTSADQYGLDHNCASRPGASGSPMFGVKRDGTPIVLAVNTGPGKQVDGIAEYSPGTANHGVSMDEILNHPGVQELILQDKRRVPGGNPSKLKKPLVEKRPISA